jgi:hypothetical protein
MFMYNLEHVFTSVPQLPQNVLFSLFGDLVTQCVPKLLALEASHWVWDIMPYRDPFITDTDVAGQGANIER